MTDISRGVSIYWILRVILLLSLQICCVKLFIRNKLLNLLNRILKRCVKLF